MRRNTHYLPQVFNHCEALGQVVKINQRDPRPIASAPNEKQSYQQHVAYQRQFDNQRAAYGLQQSKIDEPEDLDRPGDVGKNPLDDDGALESLLLTQIAGIRGMMERILAEKKANEPRENIQKPVSYKYARNDAPSKGGAVKSALPLVGTFSSTATYTGNTPYIHRNSEELVQAPPSLKGPGLSGAQIPSIGKTMPSTTAQGKFLHKSNRAPNDGVDAIAQGSAAESAAESSYWW